LITFAVFVTSRANTDVTFPLIVVPFGPGVVNEKHAPVISTSCKIPHGPLDGVTDITTGALTPNANVHTVVRVNGPNTLLSAGLGPPNVVVTTIVALPPQHAAGNALVELGPNVALTFSVALTRLQFTGVTVPNTNVVSGVPSPFVSHASVAAVVTVFPARSSGSPVSDVNPWQILVTSFGKNPHPTRFNCTAHNAFTIPVVVGVVTNVPGTTV
jgi:hypothetical protein